MSFVYHNARRAIPVGQKPAWRLMAILGAAAALAPVAVRAQSAARDIVLRIRPHVGDTLYTRFEQDVEMTGTVHVRGADTTMTMRTSLLLLSHVLVQGSDETGTTVTTITDSVALATDGEPAQAESARRSMQGQQVKLHIAPNGSASVLAVPALLSADVRAVVSGMPATLPDRAVHVGQTWQRTTSLPVLGGSSNGYAATLRATYRLDSLAGDGSLAFVSMHGTLTRDPGARPLANGLRVSSSGSVSGSLCVDRNRGWWIDARATILLVSTLMPVSGAAATPVRMQTRISQRMHTSAAH